jgi:hypothetical protein
MSFNQSHEQNNLNLKAITLSTLFLSIMMINCIQQKLVSEHSSGNTKNVFISLLLSFEKRESQFTADNKKDNWDRWGFI